MKARISLIALFIALSTSYAVRADAQFWKHWFKKEEPVRKKPVVQEKKRIEPAAAPKPEPARPRRKQQFEYPFSEKKARYRVDVLAPLYLDELVKGGKPTYKGRIPEKAAAGADFCEGIKIAADTLNKLNFQVDVYIHDITDPQETPEALTHGKMLDGSDLIIGAVQSAQIPAIAQYAKKHEINFVSAVSPADGGVTNNPYFTILQPTLQKHCEAIMRRLEKQHKHERVVVYRRSSVPLDESAYNFMIDEDAQRNNDIVKVSCTKLPEKATLAEAFSPDKVNLVVMAVMDVGYAEVLLKQLHDLFPDYKFDVFGMPSWRSLQGLKKADAYPNTVIFLTTASHFDLTTAQGKYLSDVSLKSYGARANETVCRGYETLFWYAYLLRKYGPIFNEDISDNSMLPFSHYEIKQQRDENGEILYNENEHVYWYRYQDGSFMID
ncbi:MAG: hypothetical protein JSS82_20595 [Bacteroidetes bacterium]|nr:hypothetical protein [Bacteroidota bacterium]